MTQHVFNLWVWLAVIFHTLSLFLSLFLSLSLSLSLSHPKCVSFSLVRWKHIYSSEQVVYEQFFWKKSDFPTKFQLSLVSPQSCS